MEKLHRAGFRGPPTRERQDGRRTRRLLTPQRGKPTSRETLHSGLDKYVGTNVYYSG